MSNSDIDKSLHKEHRNRLRKKFFESDGDALEPHELLELLLYSVNSQKDTNPTARALIKKFGTIYNVFNASEKELKSIKGVGQQTVTLLKLQGALLRKYQIDIGNQKGNLKLTPQNAGKYAINFFYGYSNETAVMFALDANCRLISSQVIGKGTVNKVHVSVRDIISAAISAKAVYVILAHNHPNGTLDFSPGDLKFTLELEMALNYVDIRLLDHIIVADGQYLSMMKQIEILKNKE